MRGNAGSESGDGGCDFVGAAREPPMLLGKHRHSGVSSGRGEDSP